MDLTEILPISIWEKILQQNDATGLDVLSFCSTCQEAQEYFRNNSCLWRMKFAQRWPRIKKRLDTSATVRIDNWLELYRRRLSMTKIAKSCLDVLASKYIGEDILHLSDNAFSTMLEFANGHEFGEIFLLDELRYILNETPENQRLTDKYYASSAVRYLCQQSLLPRWNRWLENGQRLEVGAWMFAQWFQPSIGLDDDDTLVICLDRMVEETKARLSEINKRNSVLHCDRIRHEALQETMWSPMETRQIIDALNFVFSIANEFRGNMADYYNTNNSYLNEVIKTKVGIPITLCILYHAVARRLGVYCAPISFPSHFLLKILDHPELSSESQKYTYIDVFNSCRLMREDQVWATHAPPNLRYDRSYFTSADSVSVLIRMINNIAHVEQSFRPADSIVKRAAWELGVVLKPMDFEMRLALARKYFRLDVNIEKIIELMEAIPEPLEPIHRVQRQHFIEMARARLMTVAIYNSEGPNALKLRSKHPQVKYAVGMIMKHKQYNYRCVITGWDPICAASDSWKNQMGVQNLPGKDHQPFYHVLVHDGTNRYAAEENMVFETEPIRIIHPEVGKFFEEYRQTHYKMNAERSRQYPEDEAAVLDHVASLYPG